MRQPRNGWSPVLLLVRNKILKILKSMFLTEKKREFSAFFPRCLFALTAKLLTLPLWTVHWHYSILCISLVIGWLTNKVHEVMDAVSHTICLVWTYNYGSLWLYRNSANPNGELNNFHAKIPLTPQAREEAQISSFDEVALHHLAAVWENQKCGFPYESCLDCVFSFVFAPSFVYPPDFSFVLLHWYFCRPGVTLDLK